MTPQNKKTDSTPLSIADIHSAIARILVLASNCERYLSRPDLSEKTKKVLNKMKRVADEAQRSVYDPGSWITQMNTGYFVEQLCRLYEQMHNGKLNKDQLGPEISRLWSVIYCTPLKEKHLKKFTNITTKELGGPKSTAVIKAAEVIGYSESQIWNMLKLHKRDLHKMAGRIPGTEADINHVSLREEPAWRFLLAYYLNNLMGISINDTVRLLNQIGDLLAKQSRCDKPPREG